MICFVCLFAFCKEAFYFAPNAGCHDATYLNTSCVRTNCREVDWNRNYHCLISLRELIREEVT